MVIGYYNLWKNILIKSLNIVAKVRNCFFFNILGYKITNIESYIWKNDILRGKRTVWWICLRSKKKFNPGWKRKRDNFMTYQEDCTLKIFKIHYRVFISLFSKYRYSSCKNKFVCI